MSSNYVIMSDILALYKADQISEGKKIKYFVTHPDEEASEMYATSEENFKTLRNAFASKSSPQLRLDYYDLYQLSLEILNKRRRLNYDDYEEIITRHDTEPLSPSDLLGVWDNYIYYATKQSDLEALEVCSNLLLADFWLNKIIAPDINADMKAYQQDLKRKLNARIIFPNFLMMNIASENEETDNDDLTDIKKIKSIRNTLKAIKAKAELEELEELEKDLNAVKIRYSREENVRLKEYNSEFEDEYNEYIKQSISNIFTVSDEGDINNPPIPTAQIGDPASSVPPPKYNYVPAEELNEFLLNIALSARSRATLTRIREDDMGDFDHVSTKINMTKQELTKIINENTPSSNQVASIGGAPVSIGMDVGEKNLYGLETICLNEDDNIWQFILVLNVSNIKSLRVKLFSGNTVIGNDSPFTDFSTKEATACVIFKDGLQISTPTPGDLKLVILYSVVSRKLESISIPVDLVNKKETIDKGDNHQETDPDESDELFSKPNLFGITRLGVGEYLKINQQLCCYVPGEVSRIENIMAREIREKTTKLIIRSEESQTSEITFESEQTTDTSSTDRNELSSELSAMDQQSRAYNFSIGGGFGPVSANMSLSFNNSKESSYSLVSTKSQELVQKATERIVSKTREERVRKITNEYTEENKHGYDNRKGENHINGVYRWVDKVYKNQLVNYGRRLMYEFMIPEPASLHQEYINKYGNNINTLDRPIDPRTSKENTIATYDKVTAENSAFWANAFGIEIEAKPPLNYNTSKAYSGQSQNPNKADTYPFNDIEISDGYKLTSIEYNCTYDVITRILTGNYMLTLSILDKNYFGEGTKIISSFNKEYTSGVIPVSVTTNLSFSLNVIARFSLTTLKENEWKKKTFDAIINGYENKLKAFEENVKKEQDQAKEKIAINPNFYREIEMSVLKKNCIAYLFDKIGTPPSGLITRGSFASHQINRNKEFENYASTVKFFEQAFEWEIMSYLFYPFYWAEKEQWEKLYFENVDDLLFRNFLQSGMARVIVSVRPGFEEAVMWYMKTGQIWSGGNPPVMGDESYLSIVDELAGFVPESVVDEWEVRIPSTLTVLQTKGVELGAGSLPCYCDEDSLEEFTESLNKIGEGSTEPVEE